MARSLLLVFFFYLFFPPDPAYAHAFGTVYRTPIPLPLYLFGSVGILLISFFLIGYSATQGTIAQKYPKKDITNQMIVQVITSRYARFVFRFLGVFLLFLCIVSGFFGTQIVAYNISMTLFWVIFLVGFPYLTFFLGNIWREINPWKVMIEWIEWVTRKEVKGIVRYPESFANYPAFFAYFFLICFELVFDRTPFILATVLLVYTNYSFFMAVIFGKNIWEEHIEAFSVLFRFFSTLSIIAKEKKKVFLRPPFVGALSFKITDASELLFIGFMLASTATDGFMGTTLWNFLLYEIFQPLVSLVGPNPYQLISIIVLFLSPLLFLCVYFVALFLLHLLTRTNRSLIELGLIFAPSLLPIAFVYHFAHYFMFFIIQGQDIIALVSDPLGKGWNLFRTAQFISDPAILSFNIIWHSQVAAILIGHIAGVYLSHQEALRIFQSRREAFVSQWPLLVLMIIYTLSGLWILSQPISSQ